LGSELLVHVEDAGVGIPTAADLEAVGVPPLTGLEIGRLGDRLCYAAELPAGTVPPAGMALLGLRAVYGKVDPETYRLAGRAVQIVEWDRTHRFCGHCGTPTAMKSDEIARVCPNCGALFFPRISPAIIVLIQDGDRALLARSHRFPPGRYSTVAGFVEPGETLEETVVREVSEEVGVQIRNIRYFGSQPWPFPHSLMIGFTAEYAGGEIRIQEAEIADARWFRVDELPDLPPRMSIARQLIDWFVHSCTEK
jgi:NAD+ diphosphatase